MGIKIAINGLGRIGRCVLRAACEYNRGDVEIVAVNGPAPTDTHVHLLKYDSTHGTFHNVKKISEDLIEINGRQIAIFHERDAAKLPWGALGVDVVLECTGKMNSKEASFAHINAGAKKLIISAPAENVDATIVYGVNNDALKAGHQVISIGSCTTNCLAPVVMVLHEAVGIEKGFMTTIHSYTNDQNILDGTHKDLRRARSAAVSMIPTSTGAAKALSLVLPQMAGRLDGTAIRVPTPNVSLVDLTFIAGKRTTVAQINAAIEAAAGGAMQGVLEYCAEPLVSIDFNHNTHSSIFDATGTKVVGENFCRIAAWYDNEWGFSVRMLDVANLFGNIS
jgi:glyceraldehyde 3-phosphate dehydrogenase